MSDIYTNVGRLDAGLRGLAAVGVVVGILAGLATFNGDWGPSLLIHGLILVAYLAISAYVHIDPLYYALGWSTLGRRRVAQRQRVRRLRGRPM